MFEYRPNFKAVFAKRVGCISLSLSLCVCVCVCVRVCAYDKF